MISKNEFYAFAKAYIISPLCMLIFIATTNLNAQEKSIGVLSKKEAMQQMLENNFGIQVTEKNIEIAENNADILNSRYLPSVFGLAGANWDRTSSVTDFSADEDGNVREANIINGAETTRYNASINIDWTLFDGLNRYYSYKQLKEQYNLTQLEARETIETTTTQLFSVYYEVARLQENITNLEQALTISQKRLVRAEYQFEYGQVNKLEILNAEVDIVTDSTNILNARQNLRNVQRDLNVVLGREIEDLKKVDTMITFVSPLLIDSYIEKAAQNNVNLLQVEKNIILTHYDRKIAKGLFLPTIGLTGSYGWNQSNNPASTFFPSTTNNSDGLAAGASLRWNLFNGGSSVTALKNAKINIESQEIIKKQLTQQVTRDIANALGNYKNALTIYRLQEQNVTTSKANFDRSNERFKLGQITSIEFRQAQLNLINAQTSKNAAKYTAKVAEINLLQLTGQLLNVTF